jgi:hypothetical protein
MVEIGIAEYFGMGEAIGIIGTLFVVLYFSRKQTQSLSVDIETKVLNDQKQLITTTPKMIFLSFMMFFGQSIIKVGLPLGRKKLTKLSYIPLMTIW